MRKLEISIRKYKPEQIVGMLRQIEVQMANGKTAPQACKEAGIHTQTYYRWRKEYGWTKAGSSETAEGVGVEASTSPTAARMANGLQAALGLIPEVSNFREPPSCRQRSMLATGTTSTLLQIREVR